MRGGLVDGRYSIYPSQYKKNSNVDFKTVFQLLKFHIMFVMSSIYKLHFKIKGIDLMHKTQNMRMIMQQNICITINVFVWI